MRIYTAMYYLILCEIPVYSGIIDDNLAWVEIRTDLPTEPCPYYYRLLLENEDKEYLKKYATLHNYNIEGE